MGVVFDKARYFNRRLAFSIFVIAVSTFNYGFDNQAFATTQAMEAFTRRFGEYDESTGSYAINSQWLALFNSLNYIGFAAGTLSFIYMPTGVPFNAILSPGVIIGSFISARFGRRWCMFIMSVYALITATINVTSNSNEQIMAGRGLNYVYVGMELSVVPVFQSEIGMPKTFFFFFAQKIWLLINLDSSCANSRLHRWDISAQPHPRWCGN